MIKMLRASVMLISVLFTAIGSPNAHAAEFETKTLDDGTAIIFILGPIENDDDQKFRRLSIQHERAIIVLDSAGGKLMPAIEIGKMIRLAGYATMVGDEFACTSSCALIWLAGAPRYLEPAGKVGFHASYRDNDGKLEETGVGNAVIGHYLSLLNLPQRAVIFATSASPTSIVWLTGENRWESGIDYQTMGNKNTPQSGTKSLNTAQNVTPPPLVRTVVVPQPKLQRSISDMSLNEFKIMFREMFRDPKFLRSEFAKMNLDPDSLNLMLDHARLLYADDRYIDRLASEMHAAKSGFSGTEDDRAIAMSIGQAINIKLTLKGLSRLPDKDVSQYFYYILALTVKGNDAECKAVYSGKDDFGRIELRLLASLGTEKFADYLALTRRALMAELNDNPAKIIPSKVEVVAGEKAFENHLTQNLAKLEDSEKLRLSNAMAKLEDANDKDACDGYYMIFKSINDLGGLPGNWSRRNMANSLVE